MKYYTISIIKSIDLLPKVSSAGAFLKIFSLLMIPTLIIGGFLVFLIAIFALHGIFEAFMSILAIAIGFALIWTLFSGGRYKPGKSFYFWRQSKEKIFGIYTIVAIVTIIGFVFLSIIDFRYFYKYIISMFLGLMALYGKYLSFKFHEDVDFVTNNEVSVLLGMEIDEKVQASYQNFDARPIKGSNMMLLTDKRIIIAFFNGNKWLLMNKRLNEVWKFGKTHYSGIHYLYFVFSDMSTVGFRMNDFDRMTSNPTLFFKKFLVVIDSFLLGNTDQRITSRRRVSVNNAPRFQHNKILPQDRTIDISNTIIGNLRGAVPVESCRVLEL